MSQSFDSVKEYLPYFFDVTTNYYYRNSDNKEKILSGGNEMRSSVKEGKYKVISFADRHAQRISNMTKFNERVSQYSIIDEVKIFNMSNIPENVYKDNLSIFDSKRYFNMLAKVYLVYQTLLNSDDGDIILWVDSDIVDIRENGIDRLFNLCNNSEKGIVGFHNDFWLERLFTKQDLYDYLNITDSNYWNTNQAYSGFFLVKKNKFTIEFFKQWWDISSITRLFDDSPSSSSNLNTYITHKHDQSILSLLYKIHNIKTFPLPLYDLYKTNIIGLHSGYFEEGVVLPVVWESCWHNVSYKQMWNNCNSKFNKMVSPTECLSMSTDNYEL